jgi:hypothetical protein
VYDPTDANDRMLLGLRGMMSEAELHVLYSDNYLSSPGDSYLSPLKG